MTMFFNQLTICILIILSILTKNIVQSIHIPDKHIYRVYGTGDSSIQVSVLVDLLCPFSSELYNTLNKVKDSYSTDDISINYLVFVLPYHRNSWMTALGLNIVQQHNNTQIALNNYMYDIFNNQYKYNSAVTQTQVIRNLARITALYRMFNNSDDIGDTLKVIRYGLVNDNIDNNVRSNWKYYIEALNIASTPSVWINDKQNDNIDSDWSTQKWKIYIDKLLNNNNYKYDIKHNQHNNSSNLNEWYDITVDSDYNYNYTTIMLFICLVCTVSYIIYNRYLHKHNNYQTINSNYPVSNSMSV